MNELHAILHASLEMSGRWIGATVVLTTAAVALALLVIRLPRLSAASAHRVLSIAMLAPFAAAVLAASGVGRALRALVAPASRGAADVTTFGMTHVVAPSAPWVDWTCLFFVLWLGVAVLLFVRWFARAGSWSRIAREAEPVTDARVMRLFDGLATRLANSPALEHSSLASEPMVVGVFRPTLLLPSRFDVAGHDMSDAELEAVLAHELAHVERRDNLGAALHELVTVLFWFSPLHWTARRRLLELRERACDERVLEHGCEAESYVTALARTCHTAIECPAIACMSGFQIRERIESIMRYPADRSQFASDKAVRFTVIAAAVAVVLGFGAFAPQPSIADQPKGEYRLDVALADASKGEVHLLVAIHPPGGETVQARVTTQQGKAATVMSMQENLKLRVEIPNALIGATATLEVLERDAVVARASAVIQKAAAPTLPPPPPGYSRVGDGVEYPKVISRVEPKYTEEGRVDRIQGIAIVEALIDEQGVVKQVRILKDLPDGLGKAAADAVSQWRFAPATKDGKPIPVVFNITVNFKLDGDKEK